MKFQEFPKMARLRRDIIVTEKIDGTNAAVAIEFLEGFDASPEAVWQKDGVAVYAQARTRFITPENDNFGFASWVRDHAEELVCGLGVGRHFGEWWGSGIQRKYGFKKGERFFSLFNTIRWCEHGKEPGRIETADPRVVKMQEPLPECCSLVPVLWKGEFDDLAIKCALKSLEKHGSQAAPGFMNPEGIVVYHVAGNVGFKQTIHGDDTPKSLQ